jgi:hypothetical protein
MDAHLTLPWYFELRKAHNSMEDLVKQVAKDFDRKIEFNIHMDDCKPFSCEICTLKDCPVREKPFVKIIEWTTETISQEQKHQLQ